MKRTLWMSVAIAAVIGSVAAAQDGFDVIVLQEGAPKRGQIVEMSKDSISIEANGVRSAVELNNVKRLAFSDEPTQLRTARTSIDNGQLEDALEKLEQINKENVPRDIVEQEVDFYKAYCASKLALVGTGDKLAAGRLIGKFAENSGSYHYYQANEIMGDLAAALNRPDSAATYYRKVAAAPWPDYKMRAAVLEGQALIDQNEYAEAEKRFDYVLAQTVNTPVATRQKEFANLGKAICVAQGGQPDAGVQTLEKIIANGDSRDGELFARTYNALGRCHALAKRPKDALLAYLHVDLLFYQDSAQHAEALYHLWQLWGAMQQEDRALKSRSLLRQRYPGSRWSSKQG